jgi:hypothetical protein
LSIGIGVDALAMSGIMSMAVRGRWTVNWLLKPGSVRTSRWANEVEKMDRGGRNERVGASRFY